MKPIITKADIAGWRIETPEKTYYVGEWAGQGTIYKDHAAFESQSFQRVCYVPEYDFDNSEQNMGELFEFADKCKVSREITDNPYVTDRGLTYYDIREQVISCIDQDFAELNTEKYGAIWGKFVRRLIRHVFDVIDWQSPSTYANEIDIDECWEEFLERERVAI